jgi:hypothetical protein
LEIENVLFQNNGLIGLAAAWQELSTGGGSDQYETEAIHRFRLTPQTHIVR